MFYSRKQVHLGVLRGNIASNAQTTDFITIEREQFHFRNDCRSCVANPSTMRINRITISKYCNKKPTYTVGEE